MLWLTLSFSLVFLTQTVNGANILCLFGFASPSHFIWNHAIIEKLAEHGHNLTVVSANVDKQNKYPDNVHYILLEAVYSKLYGGANAFDLMEFSENYALPAIGKVYDWKVTVCEGILASQKGLNILQSYPNDFKFDLVINDFTGSPCLLGFLYKFKYPPMIGVTAFNNPPYTVDLVGGHRHHYIPFYLFEYGLNMNYWQRFYNTLVHIYDIYYRNYVFMPVIDRLMREYHQIADLPFAGDLDRKTSLLLVNSHVALDFAEENPANVIPVGGLHIQEPKPLPEPLETFVQKSRKGAVLFSLGTNIRSDTLTPEVQQMFLKTFEKFPDHSFLWKFENENTTITFPPNVMIQKWMPQNDILAHPKTVAFITHSGLLSTQEATWYGVPMIGIPFIVDQYRNVHRLYEAGVAEKLDFKSLTMEKFEKALHNVLEIPSYKNNMKLRSKRFRDQPEKPISRAVWHIEYIMRHPDAVEYLASPTTQLGIIKSNSIDVYLGFAAILLFFVSVLHKICQCVVRCCNKNKNSKSKKD